MRFIGASQNPIARKRYSASLPARFGADIRTQPVSSGFRARSSAGEHLVDIEGVTGSIPVAPTIPAQPNLGSFEPASVLIPSEPVRLYGRPLYGRLLGLDLLDQFPYWLSQAFPIGIGIEHGRQAFAIPEQGRVRAMGRRVAKQLFRPARPGRCGGSTADQAPRSAFRCSECRDRRIAPRICWGPNRDKGFSVALASALER